MTNRDKAENYFLHLNSTINIRHKLEYNISHRPYKKYKQSIKVYHTEITARNDNPQTAILDCNTYALVMALYRSWPAVSHICALTILPSTSILLQKQATYWLESLRLNLYSSSSIHTTSPPIPTAGQLRRCCSLFAPYHATHCLVERTPWSMFHPPCVHNCDTTWVEVDTNKYCKQLLWSLFVWLWTGSFWNFVFWAADAIA